eukprot:324334-Chlamydomonas_euryale.AAC.10
MGYEGIPCRAGKGLAPNAFATCPRCCLPSPALPCVAAQGPAFAERTPHGILPRIAARDAATSPWRLRRCSRPCPTGEHARAHAAHFNDTNRVAGKRAQLLVTPNPEP